MLKGEIAGGGRLRWVTIGEEAEENSVKGPDFAKWRRIRVIGWIDRRGVLKVMGYVSKMWKFSRRCRYI